MGPPDGKGCYVAYSNCSGQDCACYSGLDSVIVAGLRCDREMK